jgi:hypothetical protein
MEGGDNPFREKTLMISGKPSLRARRGGRTAALLLALSCISALDRAYAEGLPAFRPGLWEFNHSMEDNSGMYRQTRFTRQRCADPTADLRKTRAEMSAQGCSLSPLSGSGDFYEGTATCQAPRSRMESHITLTAAGGDGYRLMVTSRGEKGSTTEEITARRLGDCPARSGGH